MSIQFGTGNKIVDVSNEILQRDFAVFFADSAAYSVKDVTASASAWPTWYRKGANECVQRKRIYEFAYYTNNDGVLDPDLPPTVSVSGKTDATGIATVSLRYPRDRANWVKAEWTVSGSAADTGSVARNEFWLPAVAKDLTDRTVSPPAKSALTASIRAPARTGNSSGTVRVARTAKEISFPCGN